MIRIGGPTRTIGTQGGRGARKADGTGATFSPTYNSEQPARAATTSPATATPGLDVLLALQAIDGDQPRKRKRAAKQGHDLLDVLEEIKIGLLSGHLSGDSLDRISALVGGLEASGDERLDALVADISLRAQVEMAKLGHFVDQP
jgi:hypothetical protein